MKRLLCSLLVLLIATYAMGQITGIKTIPGDYGTIQAAITALNTSGTAAPGVTFNVAANYTETAANLVLTTTTGSAAAPIVFQKSGTGNNPKITAAPGTGAIDGIIEFGGADYVTFSEIDVSENPANADNTTRMEWGYGVLMASATDASHHIVIRNCVITMNKVHTGSYGIYMKNHNPTSTTGITPTSANGVTSYCKFFNNNISNVYTGVYLYCNSTAAYYGLGNEVGVDGGNSITNYGGAGTTAYGVYAIYQDNLKIANNVINGGAGTTTTLYGIFASTGTNSNVDIYGNTVTITGGATTSTIYAINNAMGGTGTSNTVNIYNNIVENCSYPTATSGAMYLCYNTGAAFNVNMYNNIVRNNSKPGTGAMYCLYESNTGTNGFENLYDNLVHNNTNTGAATMYGIYSSPVATTTKSIHHNTIHSLSTGGGTTYGFYNVSGTTSHIYKNRIYNIENTGATGIIHGMYYTTGTAVYVYNNFVSDLRTPNATGVNSINGIYVNTPVNIGLYYNTIYLNASSSSTSTFGTTAIYGYTLTPTIDMRNNIIVNTSTPVFSSGDAYTVAHRRSSDDLTKYSASSDYNCFHAGAPSARNLIFFDGTNGDQTIGTYQARVAPRDAHSFSEVPPFVNPATSDLHLQTTVPTTCESGGTMVSTPIAVTDDYDAAPRWGETGYAGTGTAPDVGADEGNFTLQVNMVYDSSNTYQLTGYAYATNNQSIIKIKISTTGSNNPLSVTQFTVNANGTTDITDINATPAKIYYTGGSEVFGTATLFGSTTPTITNFTITGTQELSSGNNYFWLAYDVISTAVTGHLIDGECINFTLSSLVKIPATTAPAGYKTIVGKMSGTYDICASCTPPNYTTITSAMSDLTNRGINGAVTFTLSNPSSTPYNLANGETFPITIPSIDGASASYTITFKPAPGISPLISDASATSIFKFNGTDYFTLDGSNNGTTSRDLTISNTSTGTTSAVLWIASSSASDGATNNTFKNCNLFGNSITTTLIAIYQGGTASISTTGAALSPNSNNSYINNFIKRAQYGILSRGPSASNLDIGNIIQNNSIGESGAGEGLKNQGIYFYFQDGVTISGNHIQNIKSTTNDAMGINLYESKNGVIAYNEIHDINLNVTSTYKLNGILVRATTFDEVTNQSGHLVHTNVIYDLTSNATSTYYNTIGIHTNGGWGDEFYYNSVYMTGNLSAGVGQSSCFSNGNTLTAGTSPDIILKNNVFYMNGSTTGAASVYSHYTTLTSYTGSAIDYNDLYVFATGSAAGYVGYFNTTNQPALSNWTTATSQDLNSISTDPMFNSATSLVPQTGSPLLGAGVPISGIALDIIGNPRSGLNPSIGAYEVGGDVFGPIITYTPLANTANTGDRTLTTTITDISGVPTSGIGLPRLYWKINSGSWNIVTGTHGTGDEYTFQFGNGAGVGDIVSYFVVAQDMLPTPIPSVYPSAGAGGLNINPPSCSVAPSNPSSYAILTSISGVKNIPGDYPSLTGTNGIFNAINNNILTGNLTINITSNLTETGQVSLNPPVEEGAGNYTITIQPDGSKAMKVISGSTTSSTTPLININGADRVIIDGGASNELTFVNTNATSTTTGPTIQYINGATSCTLTNCIIESNATTSTTAAVLISTGNNTVSILDNQIHDATTGTTGMPYTCIRSSSTGNVLNIDGNYISNFDRYGIYLASAGPGCNVNNNHVFNNFATPPTTAQYCIYCASGDGQTISGNFIGGSGPNCTGSYVAGGAAVFYGIYSAGSAVTGNLLENNTVKNIHLISTGASSFKGIYGNGGIVTIQNNTIGDATELTSIVNDGTSTMMGIHLYCTGVVSDNFIGNIHGTNATTHSNIYGIRMEGNYVQNTFGNKIRNIGPTSAAGNTVNNYPTAGIMLRGATTMTNPISAYNNEISLGGDGYIHDIELIGVWSYPAVGSQYVYYNSIYLEGTMVTANTRSSSGLYKQDACSFGAKNNAVYNNRTNGAGGTGFNVAVAVFNTTTFTSDYNDLYTQNPATVGYWTPTLYDFAGWKTNSLQDANSISADPMYLSTTYLKPTSGSPLLGIATPLVGIVDDDLEGVLRSTTAPTIGAYETTGSADRALNLTVYLEGLWNGVNMNEAQDDLGSHWGAGIADHVTLELHNGTTPYGFVWSQTDVVVGVNGNATVTVPAVHNGNYYIVIKHRNSIETWSGAPVSFAASPINYNFTDNANKAYGDNQQNMGGGAYAIFGGDVNLDGVIDSNDMGDVDNDSNSFVMGYVPTDANGDGVVDSNDMGLVDNNANAFIMLITP